MTYDPGKILPNLTCPNCGFVGLMKIVGSNGTHSAGLAWESFGVGFTYNQCGLLPLYVGRKPGFPKLSMSGQKFTTDPTSDLPK